MLELMSYGLTGLAAVVVIAFCFAHGDEFSPGLKKLSIDQMDGALWPLSRQSGERTAGAIYSGTNESVHGEAFHG